MVESKGGVSSLPPLVQNFGRDGPPRFLNCRLAGNDGLLKKITAMHIRIFAFRYFQSNVAEIRGDNEFLGVDDFGHLNPESVPPPVETSCRRHWLITTRWRARQKSIDQKGKL